jgi:peptidoglycan/LPS O-acetylase OafA/YrhL
METPTDLPQPDAPMAAVAQRYHDLDALRAFAMLLGIVLHGAISFFPKPSWPAQDLHQPVVEVPAVLAAPLEQAGLEVPATYSPYEFMLHAIHGFRLPLFFLVSGFFTAMLWRNRGLKQLAKHRTRRILLPLAIFVPITWTLIIPVGIYGGAKKEAADKLRGEPVKAVQREAKPRAKNDPQASIDIGKAAGTGNVWAIERYVQAGADLNQRGPDQSTPIMTAATFGRVEAAKVLIEAGAELDLKNKDGATGLLIASFFAHPEIVEALLEAGADPNISNNNGSTALDTVQAPWEEIKPFYAYVGEILGPAGVVLDYERIRETRPQIAETLRKNGAEEGHGAGLAGLIMLIFFVPVFHHLWFLYYLVWLVAGFILITWLLGKLKLKALPDWLLASPFCWLWLLPVTFLPQLLMQKGFGPATETGAFPWPPILVYYAVFFFFGALCFGRDWFKAKAGKLWPLSFVLAVPPLLVGLCLVKSQQSGELLAACSVAYAWLIIFGCIGFFRHFFPGANPRIRYLSDASYWLYIMHLPVIMFVQAMISTWNMASFPKFLIACAATTLPLLLIYEFGIRYTFIGTMLNGRRTRPGPVGA